MYSDTVQRLLDKNDIEPGDRVEVSHDDRTREGTLMPRSKQGNTDAVVIKLDNGYNLGIDADRIDDIELVEEHDGEAEQDITIPEDDDDLPDIAILHTGGTIASRVSYKEGGVKPAFEPEDLLQMYPELFQRANVESEVIAQMLSEDMEPQHWQEIARAVADHQDMDGIIIGHGTDTLQYTAAALSLMLENIDIPVVIVGAQRSSDRPSSDAAMNLLSAVEFIGEGEPGVYVCMHQASSDTTAAIHRGTRARKMHSSRRDAFQTIQGEPVATVDYDERDVTFNDDIPQPDGEFELRTELDADVGLLKAHPGMTPDQLRNYQGHSGLIIEGTGLGHIPASSFDEHTEHHEENLDALEELTDDGIVAMSTQTLHGRVNMNVYDAGVKIRETGVISAGTMTPETAMVKLMWCLGQADGLEEAKELFRTDIAGELPDREEHDDYR